MSEIERIIAKYTVELATPGTHMTVKKTDFEDLVREVKNLKEIERLRKYGRC